MKAFKSINMNTEKNRRGQDTIQKSAETEDQARQVAVDLSKQAPEFYAAIILSNGVYYIENRVPFIRTWERQIGQYEHGKPAK